MFTTETYNFFLNAGGLAVVGFVLIFFGAAAMKLFSKKSGAEDKQSATLITAITAQMQELIKLSSVTNSNEYKQLKEAIQDNIEKSTKVTDAIGELVVVMTQKNTVENEYNKHLSDKINGMETAIKYISEHTLSCIDYSSVVHKQLEDIQKNIFEIKNHLVLIEERTINCPKIVDLGPKRRITDKVIHKVEETAEAL